VAPAAGGIPQTPLTPRVQGLVGSGLYPAVAPVQRRHRGNLQDPLARRDNERSCSTMTVCERFGAVPALRARASRLLNLRTE
jgi:hypothetical protein